MPKFDSRYSKAGHYRSHTQVQNLTAADSTPVVKVIKENLSQMIQKLHPSESFKFGGTSSMSNTMNSTLNNSLLEKVLKKTNLIKPE